MPFTSETANGRPKGVGNKSTEAIRTAFAMLVEDNLSNMQDWLERTAEDNPAKALQIVSDIAQYSLPKLKQIDANLDVGEGVISKITVEVNTKQANEGTQD